MTISISCCHPALLHLFFLSTLHCTTYQQIIFNIGKLCTGKLIIFLSSQTINTPDLQQYSLKSIHATGQVQPNTSSKCHSTDILVLTNWLVSCPTSVWPSTSRLLPFFTRREVNIGSTTLELIFLYHFISCF